MHNKKPALLFQMRCKATVAKLLVCLTTGCLGAAAQAEDATQLGAIEIKEKADTPYVAKHASTATKTDTPLLETPVSVQVVPAAVIEDQRVNRLQEALENVSGLRSHNNDLEGYSYKIRGFNSLNLFRNGLAVPLTIATIEEMANIAQVEVLKGPSSILYGRIDPGGLINLVTKKPSPETQYQIEQEIGSYDHLRTTWDATGALNQAGSISYRFSGAYQDENSFRDFQGGHRIMAAPSINFALSENTSLLLDLQYMYNKAQSDTGFPVIGDRPAPIPLSRSFQEPNDPLDETTSHHIGYEFKHRFDNDLAITNRFLYSEARLWKLNMYGWNLNEATGVLDRSAQFQLLDGKVYSTNLDLTGRFEALGMQHDVLLGIDYLHDYYDYNYAEDGGNFPINIFNPVYGSVTAADYQNAVHGVGFASFSSVLVKQTGFYAQDQITLTNRWHLLLGGRYDDATLDLGRSNASKPAAIAARKAGAARNDTQFSPRLGVLYRFTPRVSGFASYSESFGANNGISATGKTFDPEKSTQHEIGIKAELMSGLNTNLALFHLVKENVLTADLSTPDPTDSIISGEQRSQGVELDVLGQLTERLSLVGNYAYTSTKVTQDNNGLQGKQLDNVPRHTAKVFLTYDLGSGGLGWRVGGGAYAADHAQGDRANSFSIPGYVRLDALVAYRGKSHLGRWTAQLNLRNILDKKYFDGTDNFYNAVPRINLIPAQPFTATATVRLEF